MDKIDNQTFFKQYKTANWTNPPIVVAWKFSSGENLGALLRVCDNFGVKQVLFVGNEKDYKQSKIKRNATTSFNKIDWKFISDQTIWETLSPEVLKIGVDTTSKSIPINEFDFSALKNAFCLFFGNETIGLENEVLQQCDTSVHIPMLGESFSMNVVQSASVLLFEAARQSVLSR